jgi:ATP-dependent Clp protease ATP-binding subunit ClpA
MSRVIHNHIKRPLADLMLFGPLKEGGLVRVEVEGQQLVLRPVAAAGEA